MPVTNVFNYMSRSVLTFQLKFGRNFDLINTCFDDVEMVTVFLIC